MTKKKIFCFNSSGDAKAENVLVIAVSEDGALLNQHLCSDESFGPGDMGIGTTQGHMGYNAYYGVDGWELEWVPTADINTHPGLCESRRLATIRAAEDSAIH